MASSGFPDTLVGTDSHTPMIGGIGVVGWDVGGIEAEAAMLGQPITVKLPTQRRTDLPTGYGETSGMSYYIPTDW